MPIPPDASAPGDFDFILGEWRVRHRRLDSRLTGCTDWTQFDGLSTTRAVLGGLGNVEDNLLHFPDGDLRAVALRSYDRGTGSWAIWWLDGRAPHELDVPLVGRFDGAVGTFLAQDTLRGEPIVIRFLWRTNPGGEPSWEQAFSRDAGATWETNWTMAFTRIGP